jgi:hypothetical protein
MTKNRDLDKEPVTRDRQTHTQTDRRTDGRTDRQTDRQTACMTKSRDLVREPRLNNLSPETDRQTDRQLV